VDVIHMRAEPAELAFLRRAIRGFCARYAVQPDVAEVIVLTINEVCTTIVRRAGYSAAVEVHLWMETGVRAAVQTGARDAMATLTDSGRLENRLIAASAAAVQLIERPSGVRELVLQFAGNEHDTRQPQRDPTGEHRG
jgi:hypothetical protein